ncbi:MAG: S41 family peptidase [Candidatus Azobacteroides sp.]|nr:S41 family peptidase [Candidatus Azobacteroides sp.]
MKNKYLIMILALIAGIGNTGLIAQKTNNAISKLSYAVYAIENLYVDTLNQDKLVEDAIVALLENLDPHSDYLTAKEAKELNEPLQGNFDGIGIQFNMLKDTLFVVQTIAGGPSEKVGIMAGDRIVSVNDTVIAGVNMTNTDIMKRLRGRKGTTVSVDVIRRGVGEPITFKIVRDKIPIYSLDASYMVDKETGYIKLNRFASSTHEEFGKALKELQQKGMKNLILDLQGNGGGYLTAAIDIADEFLKNKELIVYTEGAHQPKQTSNATAKGSFQNGRLAVLVDEGSASASEIVTGALQDWDRAVVVGRRTFGKGLVQRPIPFSDGSMLRLTIARYYTPAGRSIQKPYEEGGEAYHRELMERYNHGELIHADSIQFPDSLKYRTLLNHRIVYGGGGIMPDIFIPLDTTRYTDYHRDIVAKGILNRFSISFYENNREEFRKLYPDFTAFEQNFVVTDTMMQQLLDMAEEEKITFNQEQYDKSKPLIQLQIKALVARDLFEMNEYYQIINTQNESLQKAREILNNPKEYQRILSGT